MNKKLLLLIIVFFSSFVYAQTNPMNLLTMDGLNIPSLDSAVSQYFGDLFVKNPELKQVMEITQTGGAWITDPRTMMASTLFGEIQKRAPEYVPLIEASNDFVSYAAQSGSGVLDYNLPMDNNGVIQNGKIEYEKTDVNLNGVIPKEDGKFEYNKTDASVTIGKNTYTGVDPGSDLVVDKQGNLVSANLTVNKATTMYFGDRAYKVQPGTNVNYNYNAECRVPTGPSKPCSDGCSDKDLCYQDKCIDKIYCTESYQVDVKSKEDVEFSFPELDEQGRQTGTKNYKIKGDATFTKDGVNIHKDATLTDVEKGFKIHNSGKDDIFVTDKKDAIEGDNYIFADKTNFEFKLKESELTFIPPKDPKSGIGLKEGEELKLTFGKESGAGYLSGGEGEPYKLIRTEGSIIVNDPRCSEKTINDKIIEKTTCDDKNGEDCQSKQCVLSYETNGVVTNGQDCQVCEEEYYTEEPEQSIPTGESILSFLKLKPVKIEFPGVTGESISDITGMTTGRCVPGIKKIEDIKGSEANCDSSKFNDHQDTNGNLLCLKNSLKKDKVKGKDVYYNGKDGDCLTRKTYLEVCIEYNKLHGTINNGLNAIVNICNEDAVKLCKGTSTDCINTLKKSDECYWVGADKQKEIDEKARTSTNQERRLTCEFGICDYNTMLNYGIKRDDANTVRSYQTVRDKYLRDAQVIESANEAMKEETNWIIDPNAKPECGDGVIQYTQIGNDFKGEECEFPDGYKEGWDLDKTKWVAREDQKKDYYNSNHRCDHSDCMIYKKSDNVGTTSYRDNEIGLCNNSRDDDKDGLIRNEDGTPGIIGGGTDCEDSDCANDPYCRTKTETGVEYCEKTQRGTDNKELKCDKALGGILGQWSEPTYHCTTPLVGDDAWRDPDSFYASSPYYITTIDGKNMILIVLKTNLLSYGQIIKLNGGACDTSSEVYTIGEAIIKKCYIKCGPNCIDCKTYMNN